MGTPNTIDADRLKLIDRLATLPPPDFMHAHKLSDPIGSGSAYRAYTVLQLIDQAVAAERARCAKLVKDGDTTGHEGYIETTGDLLDAISDRLLRD